MFYEPAALATVGIIAALILLSCCFVMYLLYTESVRANASAKLVNKVYRQISNKITTIVKHHGQVDYHGVLSIVHSAAHIEQMVGINVQRNETGLNINITHGEFTSEIIILNTQINILTGD